MGIAHLRAGFPVLEVGRIHRVIHESVRAHLDARLARGRRPVQAHRGAERAPRNFERPEQAGDQGARPDAFIAAPTVVDRPAERYRHRPERQHYTVDLDRLSDAGGIEVFRGDAPYGSAGDVAHLLRPLGRVRPHVLDELAEAGVRLDALVHPYLFVGADFQRVQLERPFQCRVGVRMVVRHRALGFQIPDEGLLRLRVAQKIAVGPDQVGGTGMRLDERHIQPFARMFMQHQVDHCKQECGIGLRFDRYPFRRAGAGHRNMRFYLHPLHPAHARIGMAPGADHAARSLGIGAEGKHVTRGRRVRADGERAVPQLPVQMLGMRTIDALATAERKIHRAPSGEVSGEGTHVIGRDTAAAEAGRQARVALFVQQPFGPCLVQFGADGVQRLVPADRHELRIVVAPLLGIGALHRLQHPVRVVGLLHQAIRLDAAFAAARMHFRRAEIRLDLGCYAVLDLDREQVGARYALVAVLGDFAHRSCHGTLLRACPPDSPSLRIAAKLGNYSHTPAYADRALCGGV